MKKVLFLLVMFVTLMTTTGCYLFSNDGSYFGVLESISFYTIDGEEIEGEYRDYYQDREYFENLVTLSFTPVPLNSPAPIMLYYSADIEVGMDVIVRFTIKENNGYTFSNLNINEENIAKEDFYRIEQEEDRVFVEYLCENVQSSLQKYEVGRPRFQKEIDGETRYVSGSVTVESRTQIVGFYFRIIEEQEE